MLEEQDAELNSTAVSGNTTCAKRGPDVRVVAEPAASESGAASTEQKPRSTNRAHRHLRNAAGTLGQKETMQQLNGSLHITAQRACNAAKLQRDRMCRIIHTQSVQKIKTL